ncbi:MAG: CUAEP/CCAEP-tail radical SAM (seleno)protein [Acidobacteriota bacterium]
MLKLKAKRTIEPTTNIVLISCYELGHQPAGIASSMGFLHEAGYQATVLDLSVTKLNVEQVRQAKFVGISVPMHTALRLGVRVATEIRSVNPACHICFYGLYAILSANYLLTTVADSVIGGEYEEKLLALIKAVETGEKINIENVSTTTSLTSPVLKRLHFPIPDRNQLPSLEVYARLIYQGEQRLSGYVEASRGCLHHCTHCPIPPVYQGRFFVVPRETVLTDIGNLVRAGAQHITFGDPDFLNGPGHSLRIVQAMHNQFPQLTFDFTTKVEHIIKHRELFPLLGALGCLFVISAVESLSELVLARLAKGHTRADVFTALEITRNASIALRPTFVPFTPWSTLDDYIELLEFIHCQDLVDHVDPIQYAIRLLVPPGSLLLTQAGTEQWLGPLVEESFSYSWQHTDIRLDQLQQQVRSLVETAVKENRDCYYIFREILALAYTARGDQCAELPVPSFLRRRPPRLTEAWFC